MTQLDGGPRAQTDAMGGHTLPQDISGFSMGYPYAYGPFVAQQRRSNPATGVLTGLSIALFVLGGIMLLGPMLLFALGGGGNTDRFMEQMSGSFTTGFVCLALAAIVLVITIVRSIAVSARRTSHESPNH